MGWMVHQKQGIKKTVEFAFAYVTDIADLHWASISRITSTRVTKTRHSSES